MYRVLEHHNFPFLFLHLVAVRTHVTRSSIWADVCLTTVSQYSETCHDYEGVVHIRTQLIGIGFPL